MNFNTLKELIEFFVVKLTDKPELIKIIKIESDEKNILEIRVASQDVPRLIGKEGRTFKSLQSMINLLSDTKIELVIESIL